MVTDFDDEGPIAEWKTTFLPDWEWEAYDKEENGICFGRIKSPSAYGRWEYGYFARDRLEETGVYRTDLDSDDETPLLPDGGSTEDVVGVYGTELEALLGQRGNTRYER